MRSPRWRGQLPRHQRRFGPRYRHVPLPLDGRGRLHAPAVRRRRRDDPVRARSHRVPRREPPEPAVGGRGGPVGARRRLEDARVGRAARAQVRGPQRRRPAGRRSTTRPSSPRSSRASTRTSPWASSRSGSPAGYPRRFCATNESPRVSKMIPDATFTFHKLNRIAEKNNNDVPGCFWAARAARGVRAGLRE